MAGELRDGLFWDFMESLSACLCQELADAGGPELCFCGVIPGNALDTSLAGLGRCEGMAWVRMVNVFPSILFPQPDQTAGCETLLAVQLEIGVLRGVTLGDEKNAPTLAEEVEATQIQLSDMSAMHRAIACCMKADERDFLYLLGQYQPDGPDGGLVGGTWTVTLQQPF